MNKQRNSPMGVGVLTILTILLVLMLAIFASLTFVSAKADLSLSQINADTVTAYYAADSKAAQMAREFAKGSESELFADIPITSMQNLHLELVRTEGNSYEILAWNVVSTSAAMDLEDPVLNVWDGSAPDEP